MKNQKGITLVALIITIIVMVILAGVIIVSAVADGGIIDRAQEAMKQKERGELEDLIIASYEYKTGASGGNAYAYLDLNATSENIWNNLTNNGFKLKDVSGNEYTSDAEFVDGQKGEDGTIDEIDINAKGDHGEYTGTVTKNGITSDGIVIGSIPPKGEKFTWKSVGLTVETNVEYIAETGLILCFLPNGILEMKAEGLITIDATNSNNIVDNEIKYLGNIDGTNAIFKFAMNDKNKDNVDIIVILFDEEGVEQEPIVLLTCEKTITDNEHIYSNEEILKRLNITNYTGTYNGTWTKIGEEEGMIKLVSTSDVSYHTFGYDDPGAKEEISIEGTQPTKEEKIKRAIWSYTHLESSLDEKAKKATGIENARSVRIKDIESLATIEKGTWYGDEYTYNYTTHQNQIFVNKDGEVVKIDSPEKEVILEDTHYYDELTKEEIGSLAIGHYWVANSTVYASEVGARFGVRCMSSGGIFYSYLYSTYESEEGYENSSDGVRAVILIPAE